jgi:hypothetical protein
MAPAIRRRLEDDKAKAMERDKMEDVASICNELAAIHTRDDKFDRVLIEYKEMERALAVVAQRRPQLKHRIERAKAKRTASERAQKGLLGMRSWKFWRLQILLLFHK